MTPEQRRERHHYRPRAQLNNFAAADGLLWQYARDVGLGPRRVPPQDAAVERLLYAPAAGADPKSDEVEIWLDQEIERPSGQPLRKLIAGEPLRPEDRARIARLVAVQDMRTPAARDFLLDIAQKQLDSEMAPYIADPERVRRDILERTGEDIPVDEIAEIAADGRVVVEKPFWLEFLGQSVDRAARRIYEKGWWRISAPQGLKFVTSDIGIAKFRRVGFQEPIEGKIGWWNFGFHWVIPLTPTLALGCGIGLRDAATVAEEPWARELNEMLVRQAKRFAYSQDEEAWIPSLLCPP